ncbi:alpha/beta fold hydrolase [Polyangium mundeleinium]|uniref:Alpha/beta fold hydrolase n=1 Tax=Polyangium mundeleinium TaxID=2995306 RepID=A0ABT5EVB7_9BACT|nr:alpha/beta fold hydrolase [Polyangium mundeleinium]MDC0745770.1 alpha/beta fold hydrolase [Polyangium mundeleinium]
MSTSQRHDEGLEIRHRTVDVGEVRLHIAEAGSGPLVLLLHGFPEFWYAWRRILPALAREGFHVVVPDMRGYGSSDKPEGIEPYGTQHLAADIAGLIRALGAPRASVVGHDWGAAVAWCFAMAHPELLERLVVINGPHPERMLRDGLRSPRQLARSWYMFMFQLPGLPERLMSRDNHALLLQALREEVRGPNALGAEELEQYREAFAAPGALTAMINYYRAAIRRKSQVRTHRVDAPVLVLWGDEDRHLGRELADPGADLAPDVRIVHVPGATHWIHHERPELVTSEVAAFLRHKGA